MDEYLKASCNNRPEQDQHQAAANRFREELAPAAPPCPEPKRSHFHGLNLGIIKIGVDDRGSLALGVNVGIAHVDTRVGKLTGVNAGAGVGPIGANADVGVGIYRDGLHSHVKAGAGATDLVGGRFNLGAQVGPKTGVESSLNAVVGPAHTAHGVNAFVSQRSLDSGYEGNVGVGDALQVGGQFNGGINDDSAIGAKVGVRAGNASIGTGAEITTDGNRMIRPDVQILRTRVDDEETIVDGGFQFGPAWNAKVIGGVNHRNWSNQEAPHEPEW